MRTGELERVVFGDGQDDLVGELVCAQCLGGVASLYAHAVDVGGPGGVKDGAHGGSFLDVGASRLRGKDLGLRKSLQPLQRQPGELPAGLLHDEVAAVASVDCGGTRAEGEHRRNRPEQSADSYPHLHNL